MGKKTISSASLVWRHAKATAALREAEDATQAALRATPATLIMVPEFGVKHIFDPAQLERLAASYEAEHGFVPDAEPGVTFRQRIAAYSQVLTTLFALKEDWRGTSGLNSLEDAECKAGDAERAAWRALEDRLKTKRDTAPITRYLSRENSVREIWRVKKALRIISGKGVRS